MQDPAQLSQALKADSPGTSSGGDGTRVQRPRRPPVVPMRPGYPTPPMPPLPSQPQQRFSSESSGRRSLDSLAAPPPASRPAAVGGGSSSVMVTGAGAAAAAAAGPGSRSMLLPPPTASTYSLQVDPRFLHHGSSYLSAALEQSMMAQAGVSGHLVGSGGSTATQQAQRGAGGRLHASAHWGAADSGMQLVARARRSLPQAPGLPRMPAPLMAQQWGEPGGGIARRLCCWVLDVPPRNCEAVELGLTNMFCCASTLSQPERGSQARHPVAAAVFVMP